MRYTDKNGKEQQTRFHGIRTNRDYAELVKRTTQRAGCPGAKAVQERKTK